MPHTTRTVSPGPSLRQVRNESGDVIAVPDDWELLPPGDAGLTRRVKASGPTWTVKEKKGRRIFSRGVWADAQQIAQQKARLVAERSTDAYVKKRKRDLERRERKESEYAQTFEQSVIEFLSFAPQHHALAKSLGRAVAEHATPVGSGTVARTQRIPIQQRAESAVIAWMRHQTTAYDNLVIPRVKGKRREVRRMLAEQSRRLLQSYRDGRPVEASNCPLQKALQT